MEENDKQRPSSRPKSARLYRPLPSKSNENDDDDDDVFDFGHFSSMEQRLLSSPAQRYETEMAATMSQCQLQHRMSYPRLHSDSDITSFCQISYSDILNSSAERVLTKLKTCHRSLSIDSERNPGLDLFDQPIKQQTLPQKLKPLFSSSESLSKSSFDSGEKSLRSSTYSLTPLSQSPTTSESHKHQFLVKAKSVDYTDRSHDLEKNIKRSINQVTDFTT